MIKKPIAISSEWNVEVLETFEQEIGRVAESFQLDTYPNQIEIINSEQMMDAYASSGLPVNYHHWSFGKHFISTENSYRRGHMGLAYEIVINSNPCISYLMEENTTTMQALVIAHACFGHNSFFKNNYLFRTWSDAESIVDYLVFAKGFIAECEEKHGAQNVEILLDSCHALLGQGVDRYKRPYPISVEEEEKRQLEREDILQQQVNELWRTIPKKEGVSNEATLERFPSEPEENILYFMEKNSPLLKPWQREIIRIVRKIAQYMYPQRQTKVMNEGWASFWHFHILHKLYAEGLVDDGFMLEFLQHHTNVIFQPAYNSPYFNGINPYTLGFGMMQDIKRICEKPTEEDRYWFPDIAGNPWIETLHFAMRDFKDESFILQFLSPKLIRELKLFAVMDNENNDFLEVAAIHDENGYQAVREALANNYNLNRTDPNIQIYNVDIRQNRSLTLRHEIHNNRPLEPNTTAEVLKHVHSLWGFDIKLNSVDSSNMPVQQYYCPEVE